MNIKTIILWTFLLISAFGCDDFGDMNVNPNAPENISYNPELLLTGIERNMVNTMVNDAWGEGNVMAQYSAKIVFTAFDQFEWGTSSGTWSTIYRSAREANNLKSIAEETENNSYQAISLILKSWMFQIATDMWGDIPYSEALKGKNGDVFAPVYDEQEEIYASILNDLEEANNLLSASGLNVVKGDILLNGDLDNWRRFANSLQLRALMRLSNVVGQTSIDVEGKMAAIISNPVKYPLIENNSYNVALEYTTSYPNVHPRSQQSGHRVGSYDEYRMSETVEKVLEAYDDPRQMTWFAPTEASRNEETPEYSGMINGMVDGSAYEYKGGPANISKINPEIFYFEPNAARGIVMTAAEVHFIIAEAAVRFPEVAAVANAQTHYETGIILSFDYWNVEMPEDYLLRTSTSQEVSVPVAFDGSVETIITQKWLALFYTDYQGFCEFKRTGFPRVIEPGPDANRDVYPSRFLYPDEEQALNLKNHDEAAVRQAGSVGNYDYWTPVWWENK